MKKTLLTLALAAAAAFPAFAQEVDAASQSEAGANASVGGIGITSIMNLPAANAFTTSNLAYSGGYKVSGMPVNSVAPSFSSPGQWRCTRPGGGASVQGEKIGLSFAWGGDDSPICVYEFGAAFARSVVDLYVTYQRETNALVKAAAKEAFLVTHALACKDDTMADAFEETDTMKCSAPKKNARKERWAREEQAANERKAAVAQFYSSPLASVGALNLLP
jgi:hypothetical protein